MSLNLNNDIQLAVYWSDEDSCYLAKSSDYLRVTGIGETREEAVKIFYELLKDWLNPNRPIKNKGGRPSKNNVRLSCNLSKDIKAYIDFMSTEKGVNQGTFLEEMVKFYQFNNSKKA
jgi:hypothetical protein